MNLLQNATNVAKNLTVPFAATGGTGPYTYSVVPGGAGGTINSSTGLYTSPNAVGRDTIKAVDSLLVEATAVISIQNPPGLFCDVIRREMNLSQDQVFLWDQEINVPKDNRLYIAVSLVSGRPYANRISYDPTTGLVASQSVNVSAVMDVCVYSASDEALTRKEEVLMAMKSVYGAQQMALNTFYFAPLSTNLQNVSNVDGSKIPYMYILPIRMNYAVTKEKSVPYYDTFATPEVLTS